MLRISMHSNDHSLVPVNLVMPTGEGYYSDSNDIIWVKTILVVISQLPALLQTFKIVLCEFVP